MGDKVTISPLTNPENSSFPSELNSAIGRLSDEFDDVLYRDGSQTATGDLDMDSNRIINLPAPQNNTEPLRLADVEALSGDVIINDYSSVVLANSDLVAFSNGPRVRAETVAEADTMSEDLTDMVGFADYVGTTGGTGEPIYWVDNISYDVEIEGSFPYAIAQAEANGGGRVLFTPHGYFNIRPTETVYVPDNCTIDAPGRNVTFHFPGNFAVLDCRKQNFIIRRIEFIRIGSIVDDTTIRDCITIVPRSTGGDEADQFWIDQVSIHRCADGAIDIQGSIENTTRLAGTVSRCHFTGCDKTMAIGISACNATSVENGNPPAWCDLALGQAPKVFVTIFENNFEDCDQRQPRTTALAFVHAINNVHTLTPAKRDDGTTGTASGTYVVLGGKLLSQGEFFRAGYGGGYTGIDPETEPLSPAGGGAGSSGGPGAAKIEGAVTEDGITVTENLVGDVPALPYVLAYTPIPAAGTARDEWVRSIEAAAGPKVDTAPKGLFVELESLGDFHPDGRRVVKRDGSYYLRVEGGELGIPDAQGDVGDEALSLPRGSTKTITEGVITLGETGNFHAVLPETGDTDELVTIDGAIFNGRILILRPASTDDTITILETGNIRIDEGECVLTGTDTILLIWDGSVSTWRELSRSKSLRLLDATWEPDTGTSKRTANATYVGTAEVAYTQVTIQALMDAVRDLSRTVKAMKDDLIA